MAPRRLLPLTTALLLALGLGSCAKNETTAPGVDSEILVRETGPVGVAPSTLGAAAWAVNSIDSVIFVDDIDSARTEVTSFQLLNPTTTPGRFSGRVPGKVFFAPSNAYIYYTGTFPDASVAFEIKNPPARTTLSKMYFVPDAPLRGHTEYAALFTAGIRMEKGALRRDVRGWTFTTGDSIAPPAVRN